jgi:hypothetical protein
VSADPLFPAGVKSRIRTKANVAVELILDDGTRLSGTMFLGLNERVLDMLNDERGFLPFRSTGNDMLLIAKRSISICRPLQGD